MGDTKRRREKHPRKGERRLAKCTRSGTVPLTNRIYAISRAAHSRIPIALEWRGCGAKDEDGRDHDHDHDHTTTAAITTDDRSQHGTSVTVLSTADTHSCGVSRTGWGLESRGPLGTTKQKWRETCRSVYGRGKGTTEGEGERGGGGGEEGGGGRGGDDGERRDERAEKRERVLRVVAVIVRQVPAWPSGGRGVLYYATRHPPVPLRPGGLLFKYLRYSFTVHRLSRGSA
ncbi:hypothetical protein HN011_004361 [Eciton burchellii]|nr:hypothetical protein HN011_004361 [Eciton burchellii]